MNVWLLMEQDSIGGDTVCVEVFASPRAAKMMCKALQAQAEVGKGNCEPDYYYVVKHEVTE